MMKHSFLRICSVLLCAALLLFAPNEANAVTERNTESDLSSFFWFSNLSEKSDGVISKQTGSWDRTDGNGDSCQAMGFDGASTQVTLLEAEGPGAITRIWCGGHIPIRFYFYIDGAQEPIINMTIEEMTSGDSYPFVKPLVGNMDDSSGGYYCYVPIAFSESIKVAADSPGYWQMNYQIYPKGSDIVSFTGRENVDSLVEIMQNIGENPTGNSGTEYSVSSDLNKGESLTLVDSDRSGAINALQLTIPQLTDHTATDHTRREYTGFSEFTLQVAPENDGVALKRLIDISPSGNHALSVEVDGEMVGEWTCELQDKENLKSFGQIERFYIPTQYTQEKSSIRVTLRVVERGWGTVCANEYYVEAYSLVDELYVQTDRIDMGNQADETAHSYRTNEQGVGKVEKVWINTLYDTEQYTYASVTDEGIVHKGISKFTAQIDPDNEKVRIIKRINRYNKNQKFKLFVDGNLAGIRSPSEISVRDDVQFPHPTGINNAPFYDMVLNLSNKQTQGKDFISLEFDYMGGSDGIDEYSYRVYSMVDGKWILTDTLDVGDSADEEEHGFEATEVVWSGSNTLNYYVADYWVTSTSTTEMILDQLYIRVTCDDLSEPTIDAPIGAFFGVGQTGLDQNSMLMFGIDNEGTLYSYFQQPYRSICKVELINRTGLDLTGITSSVQIDHSFVFTDLTGYLKGQYHDQTAKSKTDAVSSVKDYFTYLDTEGSGHLVAIVNTNIGTLDSQRDYVETDECFYVDGRRDFSGNGTGTEDMYNGSLCFEKGTYASFISSYSYHDFTNDGSGALDRMVMVRTYLSDRVSFRDGMQFFMEGYYTGARQKTLALYYHRDDSAMALSDALDVSDEASRDAHGYHASGALPFSENAPWPAYYYSRAGETLNGLSVSSSSFTVSIDPNNDGVVLYRTFKHTEQASNEDRALLSVNGTPIGIWTSEKTTLGTNALERLGDEAIILSPEITAGQQTLTIALETVDGSLWHDASYEVYSLRQADCLCGDVNLDGLINAADALQCLQHSVSLIELKTLPRKAADVNLDRLINASDALLILQYSVELVNELPIV